MLDRTVITTFTSNIAQVGDAFELLCSLPDGCTPLVFFDPQHRTVLDQLKFGNEGERQRGRAKLPAMSEQYIATVNTEIARILQPSGYLGYWLDTFRLVEAYHLRLPRELMQPVDLIAWDCLRIGMGKRSRRRGDYLVIFQKPPVKAGSTLAGSWHSEPLAREGRSQTPPAHQTHRPHYALDRRHHDAGRPRRGPCGRQLRGDARGA